MSDLFNIGMSGLRAAQVALTATGNNISNANTPGYSRQSVDQAAQLSQDSGAGFQGAGVRVDSVRREVDAMQVRQLRQETSLASDLSSTLEQLGQIDRLLADESTGLAPALERFFGALQTAADDPSSIPARELVIGEAVGVAERFGTLDRRLSDQNAVLNETVESHAARIGALANDIADLNSRIVRGMAGGHSPNDLLDKRDQRLLELSELVTINAVDQNGSTSVFVGNGQALVVGEVASELRLVQEADPELPRLYLAQGANRIDVTTEITGGELGALLRFRSNELISIRSGLGELAAVVTESVNAVHRQGISLSGRQGQDLFTDLNGPIETRSRVIIEHQEPGSDARLALHIVDATALAGTEYEVGVVGPGPDQVEVRRLSDGERVYVGPLATGQPAAFDGLELRVDDGAVVIGDSYRLRPTREAATQFGVTISAPEDLALAEPVRAEARLGNTGTGSIDIVRRLESGAGAFADASAAPILVRFSGPDSYDLLDYSDPANPVALDPPRAGLPFAPGAQNALFPTDAGTGLVTPGGRKAGGLPVPPTVIDNRMATLSSITPETVTLTRRDADGAVLDSDQVTLAAGASAREMAARFSALADVSASADTQIRLTNLVDDAGGTPMRVYVNGIAIEADASVPGARVDADRIAAVINADEAFARSGLTAVSSGTSVVLRSSVGDDISVGVEGDTGDSLAVESISRPGESRLLAGNGAPPPPRIVGSVSVAGGVDFSFGGPHAIELALADGRSVTIALTGSYPDGASVESAFRDALTAQGLADEILVGREATDALVISARPGGGDTTLSVSGPAATLGLLGLSETTVAGRDRISALTVTGTLSLITAPGVEVEADPAQNAGGYFTNPVRTDDALLGVDLRLSGLPQAGDEFIVEFNGNGSSDNRNALRLADLELERLVGGTAALTDGYGELVEQVGTRTARIRVNSEAADALREAAASDVQAVSGVNLDEEAANLLRFQQAYTASARVIRAAQEVFDTLIGAFS